MPWAQDEVRPARRRSLRARAVALIAGSVITAIGAGLVVINADRTTMAYGIGVTVLVLALYFAVVALIVWAKTVAPKPR